MLKKSTPCTDKRIPSLDGLRGISIWFVMLAHVSSHFGTGLLHNRRIHTILAVLGYLGVTIFFVISGYLITSLLMREYLRNSRIDLVGFYRRRAVRILPASLFYVGVLLMLGHPKFVQAIYALTFTTTYFFEKAYVPLQHLWSLSVEEQFYLLWPFVFATGLRNAKRYCWTMVVIGPVLRVALRHTGYTQYSHCAPAIADSLAAGCLLAFYQDRIRGFVRRHLLSDARFWTLCLATMAVAGVVYDRGFVVFWGVALLLIMLTISAGVERRDLVLNSKPLVWSGLLSYSLYLWQQPFLTQDGPLNFALPRLALTFVAAYVSYRLVEQPMLRFRGAASNSKKAPEAGAAPAISPDAR